MRKKKEPLNNIWIDLIIILVKLTNDDLLLSFPASFKSDIDPIVPWANFSQADLFIPGFFYVFQINCISNEFSQKNQITSGSSNFAWISNSSLTVLFSVANDPYFHFFFLKKEKKIERNNMNNKWFPFLKKEKEKKNFKPFSLFVLNHQVFSMLFHF